MFVCSECGYESNKWEGKCPSCQAWNSFKEVNRIIGKKKSKSAKNSIIIEESKPLKLKEITINDTSRISTDIGEFDAVLGGGIVNGMASLIGGEPGVGKSTLLLQIADKLAKKQLKVLYVSGEESASQIKLRAERLDVSSENLHILCSTNTESIIENISQVKPDFIVIDSIQSIAVSSIDSIAGSISQLKESAALLIHYTKKQNIPLFMIGHVTKDGSVAGPKLLEHMVDTVLYFEGELNQIKILRTTKNRFGSTNEIGIFEMNENGLTEIKNPSNIFISNDTHSIGSAIGCVLEGSRAFLLEIQALVSPANYGNPQRVALGFDQKKLAVLLAVIEKHMQINLRTNDIFVNITGGIKVNDPAIDLAIIASILSSFFEKEINSKALFIGEVGLNGEIRPVSQYKKRTNEAIKMGYDSIFMSAKTHDVKSSKNIKLKNISQLIDFIR